MVVVLHVCVEEERERERERVRERERERERERGIKRRSRRECQDGGVRLIR
jgi:hypothetical protein